jgi:hypothetical protein
MVLLVVIISLLGDVMAVFVVGMAVFCEVMAVLGDLTAVLVS